MINQRLKDLNKLIGNMQCTVNKSILEMEEAFSLFKSYLLKLNNNKGIAYVIGNGGSAGLASHFCTDLVKTLKISASTLVDSNVITCLANDFGYENCYSEALKVILKDTDMLVAISSSGNSNNIINAAKVARTTGAKIITLSGFSEQNNLRKIGDLNFWLNKFDYGLVEMGHFFILHTLVDIFSEINAEFNLFAAIENE